MKFDGIDNINDIEKYKGRDLWIPREEAQELDEDEYYIVINKPSGIAIHPSILHYTDSLANGVKFYFEQKNIKKKIRPINRLDKDTSGIVIFAKNEYIQEFLVKEMKKNTFFKEYIAVCEGIFESKIGTINYLLVEKKIVL